MSSLSSFKNNKGFTLVEMMVVVTIFVIITGVVLANLPEFRDNSALDLVAEEIALTIRQAQVYGVGVRGTSGRAGQEFPAYGINFSSGQSGGSATQFYLFADLNNNSVFDSAGVCGEVNSECREVLTLGGGSSQVGKIEQCFNSSDPRFCPKIELGYINIVFKRPESEAHFYQMQNLPINVSDIAITIESTKNPNNKRVIHVWNTGHIYVDRT